MLRLRFSPWPALAVGYRSQPLVVAELDSIYAYLRARSEGRVVDGLPSRGATGR